MIFTFSVWIELTWIEQRKMKWGLTLRTYYLSLPWKTDKFKMKQTSISLAKLGNNSLKYVHKLKKVFTNKNSVTGAPKPAVFSMNFAQFPHGITLMIRIRKAFSSWKTPKGHCPEESFHLTSNSAMRSSSCQSVIQLLCETDVVEGDDLSRRDRFSY